MYSALSSEASNSSVIDVIPSRIEPLLSLQTLRLSANKELHTQNAKISILYTLNLDLFKSLNLIHDS